MERITAPLGQRQRGSQSSLVLFLVLVHAAQRGGGGDRHWGGADGVSEGTHLLGVAKLEYVSGRVLELLPFIQE